MLFDSEFSSATRNYAKRQLNWYRKDKAFLFLLIRRPNPLGQTAPEGKVGKNGYTWINLDSKRPAVPQRNAKVSAQGRTDETVGKEGEEEAALLPYRAVADEILHWCSVSQEEFRDKVAQQAAMSAACAKMKRLGRLNPDDVLALSDMEKTALTFMIKEGLIIIIVLISLLLIFACFEGHYKVPNSCTIPWIREVADSDGETERPQWSADGDML